jgi:putative glutamine amidotransferase
VVAGEDGPVDSNVTHASYLKAVAKAGAVPVVIPQLDPDRVGETLERLDGVVIVGGPDVEPGRYGADREPLTMPATPERDDFDVVLARSCVETATPLLAVCRGVQVLNVALGGSLVQHVEEHMRIDLYNETVHDVVLEPSSAVARIVGCERLPVNSLHHQALDRLGQGVCAVGHADDGTIEAIEVDGVPSVVGVQWHPELIRHRAEQLALFRWVAGAL